VVPYIPYELYDSPIIIYVLSNRKQALFNALYNWIRRRDGKQIDEDMQNYINEARYIWTGAESIATEHLESIALLAFRNESKNHPVGNEVSTSSNLPTTTYL